jgi:hypothetical protein
MRHGGERVVSLSHIKSYERFLAMRKSKELCMNFQIFCNSFTLLVPSLCGLSMFKTLNGVFSTCHFIKSLKSLYVSAQIGHPQVLTNCLIRKLLLFYSFVPLSSVCLFLVVFLLPCNSIIFVHVLFFLHMPTHERNSVLP